MPQTPAAAAVRTGGAPSHRALADKLRTGAIGTSTGAVVPGIFAFAWAFTGPLGPGGMYDPLRYASFVFTGGLLLTTLGLSIAAGIYRRLGESTTLEPEPISCQHVAIERN